MANSKHNSKKLRDIFFGNNMDYREVDKSLFKVVEDPETYMKKMRRRDFIRVVYSGINLLRLKTIESWERGIKPSQRNDFAAEGEQEILADPRFYNKDETNNKEFFRVLVPQFITRYDKNCFGLDIT